MSRMECLVRHVDELMLRQAIAIFEWKQANGLREPGSMHTVMDEAAIAAGRAYLATNFIQEREDGTN